MLRSKGLSIRKKLLVSILTFSVLLVMLVTMLAVFITYNTMRDQLIYNRRMSIGWLQDRLDFKIKNFKSQFYEFEVNKEIKIDITNWCSAEQKMDYKSKWRLISALNEVISMDSNINSIEIYNLFNDKVLLAERSGAAFVSTGDRLDKWKKRNKDLQTNLVFIKDDKEIIVAHQIYRFNDNAPIALATMQIRPYEMQDILEDIKMTKDESILVLNDQDELIEADYGVDAKIEMDTAKGIIKRLANADKQEIFLDGNFWFYREVNGGKLKILLTVPNHTIASALSNILIGGLFIAFIAVVISVIGSILFSQIFSKPIIDLSAQMRTLTLDDCTDVKVLARRDEVGVLHDSFGIMIARNQKLIAQEYQSKIEKRNAQFRALQAQINPHFMYNTLQAIGGMALKKKAPEIYNITIALSDIMRYSLNFSREMVCLREEIQYLESYLLIQNERFGNRIELNKEIAEDVMDYLIPKLILQPILENSFEHGLVNKEGNWNLHLEGHLTQEGNLLLIISDNGIGITEERLKQIREMLSNDAEKVLKASSHIGLCNVDSRIRLKYPGENYGVSIISTNGEGTTVQVLMKTVKEAEQHEEV